MGGYLSQPITTVKDEEQLKAEELKKEHDKKMDEESRKRQEEERKNKEEIEKQILHQELEQQQKENEEELENERKKQLEKTKKKVCDFNEMKSKLKKKALEEDEKIRLNVEKEIEETKKRGLEEVTEEKNKLNADKEKLLQRKTYIANANEELAEARRQIRTEKSEMVKQKEEEEVEKQTKHHEELKELNEEKNDLVKEGEKQKMHLTEQHRDFQDKLKQQQEDLYATQVENAFTLMSIMNDEQQYEDFRRRCAALVRLFNAFQNLFYDEESMINATRDDIEHGMILSLPPELSDALRALRELSEAVQSLELKGSKDEDKHTKLRQEVRTLIEQLMTNLNEMESRISRYNRFNPTDFEQGRSHRASMSTTCSDLEGTDGYDSMIDTPASSITLSKKASSSGKRGDFSITDVYKATKELISKLNDEMLKFNISAPTFFEDAVNRQFHSICETRAQTIAQITNGPSTSSAHSQITSGSTSESSSSSQPAIQ